MKLNLLNEYRIVRLSEERIADLQFLYKKTFNQEVTTSYLKKKYDTNFTGINFIGYLAYYGDGEPAAYYGVFPCMIQYGNTTILAAQSGDTMTNPEHQGKGLFTELARITYELAKTEGVKFIFGFPNKNSYPGFVKKLGWAHHVNMKTFVFKVNTFPLIKAVKKLRVTRLYQKYASVILKKYISKKESFSNSTLDSGFGGVVHDEAFFRYKKYSGSFLVDIQGVTMWIKLDGKLWIGDIERTSGENFNQALKKLKQLCFGLGCSEIIFTSSPSSYWSKILEHNFPSVDGLPIGYLDLNAGLNLDDIHFTGSDFDTF